jgi:hypothetical protein
MSAMSSASVKPTSLPVSELLSSRSPAVVPRYQRAYAWEDDQVSDLIEDVKLLLPTPTRTRGHFYGGMVAIRVDDPAEASGTKYEVVDGQQRLATFCLLLAEIARRADEFAKMAKEAGDDLGHSQMAVLAEGIRETFLYYERFDPYEGRKSRRERLALSKVDNDVFRQLLKGEQVTPTRESHKRLQDAAAQLHTELVWKETSGGDPEKARKLLIRLRDAVVNDSFVIHVLGDTRSTGYRIFTVLNDRGARLTVADLLRSRTLELLDMDETLVEQAAVMWDDILTVGGDEIDKFLAAYYTSIAGKRPRPDSLFDEFVELRFPSKLQSADIMTELHRMATELAAYLAIRSGTWPYAEKDRLASVSNWQRDRLRSLVRTLRHEASDPLLLAARARCDEAKFAELVEVLETFVFRYKNVCNAHIGPAQSAYYAQCKDLRDPKKVPGFSQLAKTLRGHMASRANDKTFSAAISTQLRYDGGGAAKANIRHLLTTIEDHRPWLRQGAQGSPKASMLAVTDMEQVTIEHIYPQSASPVDLALAPNVNRLGNLSYWGPDDNGAAGNALFPAKKAAYAASSVTLNQDLAKLPKWDLAALDARETELISEACKVWVI